MTPYRVFVSVLVALAAATSGVFAGPLTRIYLAPGDMIMRPGMQQQFKVCGLDAGGLDVPVDGTVIWTADSSAGSIDASGVFTAGATPGLYPSAVTASVSGLSTVGVVQVTTLGPTMGYLLVRAWGGYAASEVNTPQDVAVGPNGTVYVADTYNNRVQMFNAAGDYLGQFGSLGSTPGLFQRPCGVDFDQAGRVYVADSGNHWVQIFDADGHYISKIGTTYGSQDGRLWSPADVAVDSAGNIYVAEKNNDRISKFSPSGQFLTKWGTNGSADGQFIDPTGIAVDVNGDILVADYGNYRIQKFSANGDFRGKWGSSGSGPGQFNKPVSVAVDSAGHIYVGDSNNYRVQKLDSQGNFIMEMKTVGNHVFQPTAGVDVDSDGNVYAAGMWSEDVQKFDPTGLYLGRWVASNMWTGRMQHPEGVATDADGNVYVASTVTNDVRKFSPSGLPLAAWGGSGKLDGQFNLPRAMVVGPDKCIYVADSWNNRVQKFDLQGNHLATYTSGDGKFASPWAVAVDLRGNIYIAEAANHRIHKLDPSGRYVTKWGTEGSGNGQFLNPRGIAVDPSGYVYVSDGELDCIQKFTSDGVFVAKWTSNSAYTLSPYGIAAGYDGRIYVANDANILVLDAQGQLISRFGDWGYGPGQFAYAFSVSADRFGNVYVADANNNRIQKWVPTSQSMTFVNQIPDGEYVSYPALSVTAGSADLGDCFYMQSTNGIKGIRVTGATAARDSKIFVSGILTTVNGERTLKATGIMPGGSAAAVKPIGVRPSHLGGGASGYQDGVWGWMVFEGPDGKPNRKWDHMTGVNNIGLLAKTWGKVTEFDPSATAKWFVIDDGSGDSVKCVVPASVAVDRAWRFVTVVGISSCERAGSELRHTIRVRDQQDISAF